MAKRFIHTMTGFSGRAVHIQDVQAYPTNPDQFGLAKTVCGRFEGAVGNSFLYCDGQAHGATEVKLPVTCTHCLRAFQKKMGRPWPKAAK